MAEAFDTLTAAEKLQNGGLSDDQSKAIAHVIRDAITGNVATKSDIGNLRNEVKGDIDHLRNEVKVDIQNLRNEVQGDIEHLRNEVQGDIEHLRNEMKGDIEHLRNEMKGDIENLRVATKGDIEVLKKDFENATVRTRFWLVSGLVSTIGAIKALDYLMPLLVL